MFWTDFSIWLFLFADFLALLFVEWREKKARKKKHKQVENRTATVEMLHLFFCKSKLSDQQEKWWEKKKRICSWNYCWCLQYCWLFVVNRQFGWNMQNKKQCTHFPHLCNFYGFIALEFSRFQMTSKMNAKKRVTQRIKTRHSTATSDRYICFYVRQMCEYLPWWF